MDNNELKHFGIKGMHWGVRRYQNKDGSLTPAGEKRYAGQLEKYEARKKEIARKMKLKSEKREVSEMKRRAKFEEADAKAKRLKDEQALRDKKQEIADLKKAKSNKGDSNNSSNTSQSSSKNSTNSSFLNKKSMSEMSDAELKATVERLNNEKKYRDLTPEKVSFGKKVFDKVVVPAAADASKSVLTDFMKKKGNDWIKKFEDS